MTHEDIKQEVATLRRGVVHAEKARTDLIETYGQGVRPSTVSEDLCHYGQRIARYTTEIKRLEGLVS